MIVDSHIVKFRKLDAMLGRLDPRTDTELWIWTAMNAGVHLLNASLHQTGVTREVDAFHTQVEGLYCAPDRQTGALHDRLESPGDVMHVGQPPLAKPVSDVIARACVGLKLIEDLREPFVRGSSEVPPGSERAWQDAYAECVDLLCRELAIARR